MSGSRIIKAEAVISAKDATGANIPLSCQEQNNRLVPAKAAMGHFRTHALQQLATNVRCIHVPIEERPQHRSLTTCSLQIRGSMSFLMYRLE